MNHLEKANAIYIKGKALGDKLQPILNPPIQLKDARGFIEWNWEKSVIEITVFVRLRFYDRLDGEIFVRNPKMRYDLEIGDDAFLDMDNEILYDMILYSIDRATSGDRLGEEYHPINGIKHGLGTAVEFVDLDKGQSLR